VDSFVRVGDDSDMARVLANRERLGVHPRPVRVDLARFHPFVPSLPIDGATGLIFGLLVEAANAHGWRAWINAFATTFSSGDAVSLVIAVPAEDGDALNRIMEHCASLASGDEAPNVILQPFDPATWPHLLRRLDALLVDAESVDAERHCLEAMASGLPALAATKGRVTRWLQDCQTGLIGDDLAVLLRRAMGANGALPALGRSARTLVERTFGVPPVGSGDQVFLYTQPSDRLGL
jgi:glycosyltransferase involved in cell wall biosynthesis